MKATLATLVCLLTVGFLSAAEITGNNTAVVIRKEVVKSNTGYQFLCVPVNGMTLNGEAAPITLDSFLPAATLADRTKAIIGQTTCIVNGGVWSPNPTLEGGTTFWVKDPEEDNPLAPANLTRSASEPETIIFCGQDRTRTVRTWNSLPAGQVTALINDSSAPIMLEDAAPLQGNEVRTKDQILVIKANSSDYKIYKYNVSKGAWRYGSPAKDVTDPVIAPGEAFYYYKAPVDANP